MFSLLQEPTVSVFNPDPMTWRPDITFFHEQDKVASGTGNGSPSVGRVPGLCASLIA